MSTTIGIKAAGFSNITRSLRSAGRVLEDANGIASSVKNALDMEVKSKGNIERSITEFIRKSKDSDVRIGTLKLYTEEALSDFFDKDKLNAKKAPTVPKSVNKMAKNLFTITAAAVITGVTSIASGIMGGAIKIGMVFISKVTEFFTGEKKKKGRQNNKPAYAFTDDEGIVTVYNNKEEYDARVAKEKAEKAAIEAARIAEERRRLYGDANPDALVEIDANQYAGKIEDGLDLNEYIILPGMKPEYCMQQEALLQSVRSKTCTAYATLTVANVYARGQGREDVVTDLKKLWGSEGLIGYDTKGNPLSFDKSTSGVSDEIKLINIVENLNRGVPISARAKAGNGSGYSHNVACVGLKKGIDIESFKKEIIIAKETGNEELYRNTINNFAKNILISDSNGGKMKTLYDAMKDKNPNGTLKHNFLCYPDDAAGVYSFNHNPF